MLGEALVLPRERQKRMHGEDHESRSRRAGSFDSTLGSALGQGARRREVSYVGRKEAGKKTNKQKIKPGPHKAPPPRDHSS